MIFFLGFLFQFLIQWRKLIIQFILISWHDFFLGFVLSFFILWRKLMIQFILGFPFECLIHERKLIVQFIWVSISIFDSAEDMKTDYSIHFITRAWFSFLVFILNFLFIKETNNSVHSNQRPAQAEPVMDGGDWRAHVPPDARQRIVNYMWVFYFNYQM